MLTVHFFFHCALESNYGCYAYLEGYIVLQCVRAGQRTSGGQTSPSSMWTTQIKLGGQALQQIKHFHCPSYLERPHSGNAASGGPRQLRPRAPHRDIPISQAWLWKPVSQVSASAGGSEQIQGLPELLGSKNQTPNQTKSRKSSSEKSI